MKINISDMFIISVLSLVFFATNGCTSTAISPILETDNDEQFWRKAVKAKPNDPKAHWFLGATLEDLHKFKEAEKEFRSVIQIAPHNFSAHYHLGCILNATGKTAAAHSEWIIASKTKDPSLKKQSEEMLKQLPQK